MCVPLRQSCSGVNHFHGIHALQQFFTRHGFQCFEPLQCELSQVVGRHSQRRRQRRTGHKMHAGGVAGDAFARSDPGVGAVLEILSRLLSGEILSQWFIRRGSRNQNFLELILMRRLCACRTDESVQDQRKGNHREEAAGSKHLCSFFRSIFEKPLHHRDFVETGFDVCLAVTCVRYGCR